MNKDEGLNPNVSCRFSREHEAELEKHAPAAVADPFTRSEKEMVDISAPIVR